MKFAERLKELREEKRITQHELASTLNVARSTIAGYENMSKQPDFLKLIQIADYFDVSIDYLLGRTICPHPISKIDNLISLNGLNKEQIIFINEYIEFVKYINKNKAQ